MPLSLLDLDDTLVEHGLPASDVASVLAIDASGSTRRHEVAAARRPAGSENPRHRTQHSYRPTRIADDVASAISLAIGTPG